MCFGGGGGTQTTTQDTKIDPAAAAAQKNLWDAGTNMTAPFLQTPAFGVAGFNPDQTFAFGLARQAAKDAFSTDAPQINFGSMNPTMANAAQVSGGDALALMSPFVQQQYEMNSNNMRRERDAQLGQADAQGAAAGAFGGSGTALQRGQINRSYGEQVGTMGANLQAQAFQQALQTAMANAQMRQQAELQNASAGNQNISQRLQAAQLNNTFMNDDQARKFQYMQQLISQGDYERKAQQQALDAPWTALDRLRALTPTQLSSTTTKTEPDNSPSTGQQIAGGILSLAGLGTGGGTTLGGSLLSKLFK